jgi:hypothetical protein
MTTLTTTPNAITAPITRQPWTTQEDQRLKELVTAGTPRTIIAEKLGRKLSATYTRISSLGLGGVGLPKKDPSISQHFDKALIIGTQEAPLTLTIKNLGITQKDANPNCEKGKKVIENLLILEKYLGDKIPFFKSLGEMGRVCCDSLSKNRLKFKESVNEKDLIKAATENAKLTLSKSKKNKTVSLKQAKTKSSLNTTTKIYANA